MVQTRKYDNSKRLAKARERQHMYDMRMRLIDVARFELIELRKQLEALDSIDEGTNAKRQEILDAMMRHANDIQRLQRPKMQGKKRLSEAEISRRNQLEIDRLERKEVRKERAKRKQREATKRWKAEHGNEYKQQRRRDNLSKDRTCPRCKKRKLESAKWVIFVNTGIKIVICKACWCRFQDACKRLSIDFEAFILWAKERIASEIMLDQLIEEYLDKKGWNVNND